MARLTSLLLLGAGALLLVTWLVAPATSSPQATVPSPPFSPLPELIAINSELDRLETRLAAPAAPGVTRDPFQFASSPHAVSANERRDSVAPNAQPTAVRPAVTWPRLVAILSSGTEANPVRRAVFEDANALLQIRSVGEAIDDARVDRITDDAVIVTSLSAEQTTSLSIR